MQSRCGVGYGALSTGRVQVEDTMQVVHVDKRIESTVVAQLEEWLDMAKKGELTNVLVVGTDDSGAVYRGWANGHYPFRMVGQLEAAKLEFLQSTINT